MTLSDKAKSDIQWWISDAHLSKKAINHGSIDLTINTDASLQGWGASLEHKTAGGRWSNVEKEHHINYLELKAVLLGLQSLCNHLSNCHIKVLTDNTTAVAYIRKMGGVPILFCVTRWPEKSGCGVKGNRYGSLFHTYQGSIMY
jgi:hypothetical protein